MGNSKLFEVLSEQGYELENFTISNKNMNHFNILFNKEVFEKTTTWYNCNLSRDEMIELIEQIEETLDVEDIPNSGNVVYDENTHMLKYISRLEYENIESVVGDLADFLEGHWQSKVRVEEIIAEDYKFCSGCRNVENRNLDSIYSGELYKLVDSNGKEVRDICVELVNK